MQKKNFTDISLIKWSVLKMQDEDELECVPYTPVTITMRVTRGEEGQIVLFLYLLRLCTLLFLEHMYY